MASTALILLLTFLFYIPSSPTASAASENHNSFSALLVFGDSTVDTGNNNNGLTFFRADHAPYGRDFPGGAGLATGRFSNGLLVPDILASTLLGNDEVSRPYSEPYSASLLQLGANFASAGSGLDDMTTTMSGVVSIGRQVEIFEEYLGKLYDAVGNEEGKRIVAEALVFISVGTNDMVWSYYDLNVRKLEYDVGGYQDFVIQKMEDLIKAINALGGRRFLVSGLGPIGCVPIQITTVAELINPSKGQRACVEDQNAAAVQFNAKLAARLVAVQASLAGESRIVTADVYGTVLDVIKRPQDYGFEVVDRGCCGTGTMEMGILCNSFTVICPDADKYVFFDAIHPSQKVYAIVAKQMLEEYIPQLY